MRHPDDSRPDDSRPDDSRPDDSHPDVSHRADPVDRLDACPEPGDLARLLHGALEAADPRDAAIADRVASSVTCRSALDSTRELIELVADAHIPTLQLAEYGLGLELTALDRELVERHLDHCAECRAELALICADAEADEEQIAPVLEFQPRRPVAVPAEPAARRDRERRWGLRSVAGLAAALGVAVLGASLWLQTGEVAPSSSALRAELRPVVESPAALDAATAAQPSPTLFGDSFESGDTGSWSLTVASADDLPPSFAGADS